MNHIVLTTDLSSESQAAFGPVGELASKLGARVTVLHVVPEQVAVPYGYPYVPPASPAELAEYRTKIEQRVSAAAAALPAGVKSSCEIIESQGRIDRAICEYAETHGADAVAMSTHGHSGIRRLLLGSVAENVLRASHLPVFLFPQRA